MENETLPSTLKRINTLDVVDAKSTISSSTSYLSGLFKIFGGLYGLLNKNSLITIEGSKAYVYTNHAFILITIPQTLSLPKDTSLILDKKQITIFNKLTQSSRIKTSEFTVKIKPNAVRFYFHIDNRTLTELELDTKTHTATKEINFPTLKKPITSIVVGQQDISALISAKKRSKATGYNIYIDSESLEILAVGVNNSSHQKIYNTNLVNRDINREVMVLSVTELFTLKKADDFLLNIYQINENFYLKTITDTSLVDVEYFEQAKKILNDIPKFITHRELWKVENSFNKFKFTVHTKELFLDELLEVIIDLPLKQQSFNSKIKMYTYSVHNEALYDSLVHTESQEVYDILNKLPFFTLKVTNGFDYTFTFENLSEHLEYQIKKFFTIKHEGAKATYESNTDYTPQSNELMNVNNYINTSRIKTLKAILAFIKSQNLYKSTKIKSIGFSTVFKDKGVYPEIKFIKFNTSPKKVLFNVVSYKKHADLYTVSTYYKAYIKVPKELFIRYQKTNKKDTLAEHKWEELLDHDIKYILQQEVSLKLKNNDFSIGRDSPNLYYVKIPNTDDNKVKTTISLSKNNKLHFTLKMDDKANYFKISHTSKMKIYKGVKREKGKVKLPIVEQLKYTFEVNRWETTDSKIINKEQKKKHYYTLDSSQDDIIEVLNLFTRKYKLLGTSDYVSLDTITPTEKINSISRKKFEDEIDSYISIPDFLEPNISEIRKLLTELL